MDDDIRNRYRVPRRDYTAPPGRAAYPAHNPPPLTPHHPPPPVPRPVVNPNPYQSEKSQPMFPAARPYGPSPPAPKPATQYTEPRQSQHVPAHAVHQSKPRTHKRSKRLLKFSVLLVLILAVVSSSWLWAYPKYFTANPFPAQIQSNAKIALFYPEKLPTGYIVDKSSINLNNAVVTFRAVNGQKHIVFTLQSVPPSFDFGTFYNKVMTNSKAYTTPYGQATIGINDKRQLGSLAQNNTWLILSTNSSEVSASDMALIMANLKKF